MANLNQPNPAARRSANAGHYAIRWYIYKLAAGEQKPGFYNGTEERICWRCRSASHLRGWQNVSLCRKQGHCGLAQVMRWQPDSHECDASRRRRQVSFELIEVAPAPLQYERASAAKPGGLTDRATRDSYPDGSARSTSRRQADRQIRSTSPSPLAGAQALPFFGQSTVYRHHRGPSKPSAR